MLGRLQVISLKINISFKYIINSKPTQGLEGRGCPSWVLVPADSAIEVLTGPPPSAGPRSESASYRSRTSHIILTCILSVREEKGLVVIPQAMAILPMKKGNSTQRSMYTLHSLLCLSLKELSALKMMRRSLHYMPFYPNLHLSPLASWTISLCPSQHALHNSQGISEKFILSTFSVFIASMAQWKKCMVLFFFHKSTGDLIHNNFVMFV